jgi:hypothetical protein
MRRVFGGEYTYEHPLRMSQKMGRLASEARARGVPLKTIAVSFDVSPATISACKRAFEVFTPEEWDTFCETDAEAHSIFYACSVHDKKARFKFINDYTRRKYGRGEEGRTSFHAACTKHNQKAFEAAMKKYRKGKGPRPDGRAGQTHASGIERKRQEPPEPPAIAPAMLRKELLELLERARVIGAKATDEHRALLMRAAVLNAAAWGKRLIDDKVRQKNIREFRYANRQLDHDHAGAVATNCLVAVVSDICGAR